MFKVSHKDTRTTPDGVFWKNSKQILRQTCHHMETSQSKSIDWFLYDEEHSSLMG